MMPEKYHKIMEKRPRARGGVVGNIKAAIALRIIGFIVISALLVIIAMVRG